MHISHLVLAVVVVIGLATWLLCRRLIEYYDYVFTPGYIAYNTKTDQFGTVRTYCLLRDYKKAASRSKGGLVAVRNCYTFVAKQLMNHRACASCWTEEFSDYSENFFLASFGKPKDQSITDFLVAAKRFVPRTSLRIPFVSENGMSYEQQEKFYPNHPGLDDLKQGMSFFAAEQERMYEAQKTRAVRWYVRNPGIFKFVKNLGFAIAIGIPIGLMIGKLVASIPGNGAASYTTFVVDTPHGKIAATKEVSDQEFMNSAVLLDPDSDLRKIDVCQVIGEPTDLGGQLVQTDLSCDTLGRFSATSAASMDLHTGSKVYIRSGQLKTGRYHMHSWVITEEEAQALVSSGRYSYYK